MGKSYRFKLSLNGDIFKTTRLKSDSEGIHMKLYWGINLYSINNSLGININGSDLLLTLGQFRLQGVKWEMANNLNYSVN